MPKIECHFTLKPVISEPFSSYYEIITSLLVILTLPPNYSMLHFFKLQLLFQSKIVGNDQILAKINAQMLIEIQAREE